MEILQINLIWGRTWAAKIADTIWIWWEKKWYKYHSLVWYNFGSNKNTTSLYKTDKSRLYRTLRYKWAVWLNFLFDIMTPWHIDINYLHTFKPYKEANIIHLHSIQWWYFDWKILPLISKEKKIIMTLHDDRLLSGNDTNNNLFPYKTKKSYLERKKYLSNSKIQYIWVSDWMTNKIKNDNILWNNTIKTIYNGIDTNVFYGKNKRDVRNILWLPLDKKIILSIAWSGSKSNLKWLQYVYKIKEFYKNNKEYLFITIGNNKTKKINDNFREIGRIDQKIMSEYFNAADIFLYPTLADSFGLVVAEALACKCPVLTFQTWGVPELIEHKKNGYIAPYKDYNELKKWFEWIIENWNNLEVNLDNKFTQESMVKQYIDLYQSLIQKK